jgi:hypothetical protein
MFHRIKFARRIVVVLIWTARVFSIGRLQTCLPTLSLRAGSTGSNCRATVPAIRKEESGPTEGPSTKRGTQLPPWGLGSGAPSTLVAPLSNVRAARLHDI